MFWRESVLGAGLIEFHDRFLASGDDKIALIARMIVPREAVSDNG